ncbi:hypothetical protein LXL04_007420 [Taraxacum kok-saghyz]
MRAQSGSSNRNTFSPSFLHSFNPISISHLQIEAMKPQQAIPQPEPKPQPQQRKKEQPRYPPPPSTVIGTLLPPPPTQGRRCTDRGHEGEVGYSSSPSTVHVRVLLPSWCPRNVDRDWVLSGNAEKAFHRAGGVRGFVRATLVAGLICPSTSEKTYRRTGGVRVKFGRWSEVVRGVPRRH